MTPRYTGVLVEMGTSDAEGLLTAELDRDALRELWETGVEPVRRRMPVELCSRTTCPRSTAAGRRWPTPGRRRRSRRAEPAGVACAG